MNRIVIPLHAVAGLFSLLMLGLVTPDLLHRAVPPSAVTVTPASAPRARGLQAGRQDAFSYQPYERAGMLNDGKARTTFQVTYGAGFVAFPQAQAAFQYAVDIWSDIVTSTVPIRIDAHFNNLGDSTLGQAGAERIHRDFPGAPLPATWYVDAIADKNAGADIPTRIGQPDIVAEFNSGFRWYFGTDARPGPGQYDFVSVVLHELGHGLGFLGSGEVWYGLGEWGLGSGAPVSFDRHVYVGGSKPFISNPTPSAAAAIDLQSRNLFFTSPAFADLGISTPARLYAPTQYDPGSSYSHLDEATYPAGNPNSLMTPALSSAESQHNPGPITHAIFTDIGWGPIGISVPSPPGQPTVTSAIVTGDTLLVSWTSSAGISPTSHRLDFYSGNSLVASYTTGSASTSYPVSLPEGTQGTFRVVVTAFSGTTPSAPSAGFIFTLGTVPMPPGTPTVVAAQQAGANLNVSWTSDVGAAPTAHRLDFYAAGALLATVPAGPASSISIPLPTGIQGAFIVRVTAFNGVVAGTTSAPFAFTLGCAGPPTAPVVNGAIVSGNATVSWAQVSGATSYTVQAGSSLGGSNYVASLNIGAQTVLTATGLPPGFQAFVRVVANNACGSSVPSDFLLQ